MKKCQFKGSPCVFTFTDVDTLNLSLITVFPDAKISQLVHVTDEYKHFIDSDYVQSLGQTDQVNIFEVYKSVDRVCLQILSNLSKNEDTMLVFSKCKTFAMFFSDLKGVEKYTKFLIETCPDFASTPKKIQKRIRIFSRQLLIITNIILTSENTIPSNLLKIILCVYKSSDIISTFDLQTMENLLLLLQHGLKDVVTKLAIVSELEIQYLLHPKLIKSERTCLLLLSIINQIDLRNFETIESVKYAILPQLLVLEEFMGKQQFLLEFTKLQNCILKSMVEIAGPVKGFVEEKTSPVANSLPKVISIIEREILDKNISKFFPLLFNADSKTMYQNFVLHCYQNFLKTFDETRAKANQSDLRSVLTIFNLQFKLVLLKADVITSFDVLEQLFRENRYEKVMSHIQETKNSDFNQALKKSSLVFLNDQWSSFISKRMEMQRLHFAENVRITASNGLVLNEFSI